MADAGLQRGDWERLVEPLEALLPAQWSELLRPEFVYLVSYQLLTAAGRRTEALHRLQEGAALLQETVSQLESAEDIRSYLTVVPPNRRLCEALRAEGLAAPVPPPPPRR